LRSPASSRASAENEKRCSISRISGDEVMLPRLFDRAIGMSMLDAARC
jgi:hypothetical protein